MSTSIRVATLSEIPPGKGKLIEIGERQITVFNVAGVFHASASRAPRAGHPAHFETGADCSQHGLAFDAYAEDSPARLHTDPEYKVRVDGSTIWLDLPDGAV